MKSITFTEQADKSGKAFLPIETKIDSTASIGSLKILLLADSDANANDKTYEITGTNLSRTKTVAISAYPIVTISIEQADDTINEGESIEVTFIADMDPERSDFPLPYTVTDSSSTHYLKDDSAGNGSGDTRTATLNFEENLYTGKWEAKATIETKTADDVDRPHGTLTVQLVDPGSSSYYRIDNDANKQNLAIRVLDSKKWTITIADGAMVSNFNNGQIPDASFPMTSSGPPTGGGIEVKYRRMEIGGNFLKDAITENEVLSKRVGFSGGGATKNGNLTIDLEDDGRDDSEQSTVTIMLLEDPVNYNLSNNASERTGSVMVRDPSYSEINTFHNNTELTLKDNGPVDDWRIHDVTLLIKDTPTDYEIDHFARVVNYEDDNFTHDLDWYVSDSTYASTINSGTTALKSTQADTHTTDYGDWVLNAGWNSNPWDYTTADFNISRAQIDAIPLGAKARLKANMYVPTNVVGHATIDLIPNTQAYWKSSTHTKSNIITENANTYENGTRKEGIIVTYQDPLSDLVFKSKLYDGSTAAEEATLMDEEAESAWANMEKTHTTQYGRWVVGNQQACMSGANDYIGDANCYDVRFEPNLDNINKINSKIVKLDLEVSITGETDTISYIIVDEGISFKLDDNNSNIIKTTGSSPTIPDMDGTVTLTKQSGDTFDIEAKESSDNADSEDIGMNGANIEPSFTEFSSKVYGTDLTLGKWYFESSDATTITVPGHNTNTIVTRNFKFIPDDSAIGSLMAGEQRYSTITIKVMRNAQEIRSESYTVSIYKADKPTFRIFATDNSKSIDEDGTISLNVVADSDPGTTSASISYTAVNTVGNFLAAADHNTPKTHMLTNIGQDPGASTYSGDTFTLPLRTANTTDDTDGIISIKLNNPTGSLSSASAAYVTDPSNVAIVEVKDLAATVPTITIENATAVNQGTPAAFTLTADTQPHAPLAIRFTATNTTGNFLDLTNGLSGMPRTISPKITFSGSPTSTGTLSIPTILDKATETGTISVTLLPDPNTIRPSYKLATNTAERTKTVEVSRNAPSREISVDNTAININEGETAKVIFIAADDPGRSDLMIKYTPDETSTGTTYLKVDGDGNGDNVTRTAALDFEEVNNRWVAEVEIETTKNDLDQIHGVIEVSLDTSGMTGYTVTSTTNEQSVTINVKDLTVPTITIADAADVTSGTAASFILTSDIQPKAGLIFQYTPTETGSNFLMTGHSGPSPSISFSGAPITGTLSIPTQADPSVKSGEISIELMADSNSSDPSYKLVGDANANTKKVRVAANPIREISFEASSVDITEAGTATITLLANGDPVANDLMVKYTPTEKSSDTTYLKPDANNKTSGQSRTATLDFQEDTPSNPGTWKATITIETNDDMNDNKNGLIEVVLDTPSAQDGYTIADSPDNSIFSQC